MRSVREVIDFARAHPGKLANASSGNGTPGHVGLELFKVMTNTQIVHVPYKGGAAAIGDLVSGQVQLMMEGLNSITPHAKAGRVRGIGVSGAKRSDALPDVPTIAEAGVPGYEATHVEWHRRAGRRPDDSGRKAERRDQSGAPVGDAARTIRRDWSRAVAIDTPGIRDAHRA